MLLVLLIATIINWILMIILIRNIMFINKSKEWSWFWTKQDIMNWRNEVITKIYMNYKEINNLKKYIIKKW